MTKIPRKKYTLKEIESCFNEIIKKSEEIKAFLITSNTHWDVEKEARLLFLDFIKENNIYLNLFNQMIFEVGTDEWSNKIQYKRFSISEEKAVIVQESLSEWVTSQYLIKVFVEFEMVLRTLYRNIADNPEKEPNSISSVLNYLVDKCKISAEYEQIFKVFAYVRNCSHFGGIYTYNKEGHKISYKDREFEFIFNEPPKFLFPENIMYIVIENLNMYKELLDSEKVKSISSIEHIYTTFEYELEE